MNGRTAKLLRKVARWRGGSSDVKLLPHFKRTWYHLPAKARARLRRRLELDLANRPAAMAKANLGREEALS